jgi:hypothetical protein
MVPPRMAQATDVHMKMNAMAMMRLVMFLLLRRTDCQTLVTPGQCGDPQKLHVLSYSDSLFVKPDMN